MPDMIEQIHSRFVRALQGAFGDAVADTDPLIAPAGNLKFGDFQANVAMSLGKRLKRNPREVAEEIVANLDKQGLFDDVEVAGPGFINLRLCADAIAGELAVLSGDDHLGIARPAQRQTIVVDYSGPNVAKEMHVGHIRSTIIGDCIARVLAMQGHDVVRQNHLGDWGTQFGMLIEHLLDKEQAFPDVRQLEDYVIQDLETFYRDAKRKFDTDPEFAIRARKRVVALQAGDERTQKLWKMIVDESRTHFADVYDRLNVNLNNGDLKPESAYNDALVDIVNGLADAGLLQESQGARVVFAPGFEDADGHPLPMIVQKSDGGYLYATTDLAAARHRIDERGAARIIYVTDARQSQHFAMVFATLRMVGWAGPHVRLDHVPFGTILGKDNRPFKTRQGGTVKLIDLLDEAEQRAAAIINQKNPDLPDGKREAIAHAVGIGALKYADLSNDRVKDYVFDWDRMLAFDGNTAPYLQNAYVRIRSIFRKAHEQDIDASAIDASPIVLGNPPERAIALQLLQFPRMVDVVADSLEPHRLCNYLYDLATAYHKFYEACPVLTADNVATRNSRLRLSALAATTLRTGLNLLGIDVNEQM